MTELETLKAELQWAIEANADHPRTQMALKWAADTLEALTYANAKTAAPATIQDAA